jgi:hypothetical protein
MMRRRARSSGRIMRTRQPHDLGYRACSHPHELTGHPVSNQATRRYAGILGATDLPKVKRQR